MQNKDGKALGELSDGLNKVGSGLMGCGCLLGLLVVGHILLLGMGH